MSMNANEVVDLAQAVRMARSGEGRRVRTRAGVDAARLGEACGVAGSTITRWENGQRRPSGPTAVAWVRLLQRLIEAEQLSQ
jgi:transcriptional regulator with XRE-family HTH domain